MTVNGVVSRFGGIEPVGTGETGFLVYDGDVVVHEASVTPLPPEEATR